MIIIRSKKYTNYDETIKKLLNVSKNSLYRFRDKNKLTKLSLIEMIEYCLENNIDRDKILIKHEKTPKSNNSIIKEDSLEYLYPRVTEIWSEKNDNPPINIIQNQIKLVIGNAKMDIT